MNFQIDRLRVQLVKTDYCYETYLQKKKGFLVQTPDELDYLYKRHKACWPRIYTQRVDYGVMW